MGLECWIEAEQQSRDDRRYQGKSQHRKVHRDIVEARHAGGFQGEEKLGAREGDDDPGLRAIIAFRAPTSMA